MKTIWIQTFAWFAAVLAALALALAAPSESEVMGRLPELTARRLDQRVMALPSELPASRTLALVAFEKGHKGEVESWIRGLRLHQDDAIAWVRMPVLDDPGTEKGRAAIQDRMFARHPGPISWNRLLPVFTDRQAFVRATGMSGTDHAWALVIGRDGQVLARVEGEYSEDKAQALRETLLAQSL